MSNEEFRFRNAVKDGGFSMLYHAVTLDPELSDGAYRTYATYLMYAQQKGKAWPARNTMSENRNKGTATITRHNQELEDLGYITRQRQLGKTSITWIEDPEQNPRLIALAHRLKNEPSDSSKMSPQTAHKRATEEEQRRRTREEEQLPPIGGNLGSGTSPSTVVHELDIDAEQRENTNTHKLHDRDLSPKTPLEVKAVEVFGTGGAFSNASQARTLRTLARNCPEGFIEELMAWAKSNHVGFQAFVKGVRNADNLGKWKMKQEEAKRADEPTPEDDDPDEGWGDPWGKNKGTKD